MLQPCCRGVQAVIEIQRRLPNARVLYVSATGATESSNLGYMQRLGLWGVGTAFETRSMFVRLLDQRGVGELSPIGSGLTPSAQNSLKILQCNA